MLESGSLGQKEEKVELNLIIRVVTLASGRIDLTPAMAFAALVGDLSFFLATASFFTPTCFVQILFCFSFLCFFCHR